MTSTGPLGFPLTDRQAFALDAILKNLPKEDAYAYRKALVEKAPTELGERYDVSWISTEAVDRCGDVVVAKGMNDSQYRLNPIVTMQHCYELPPVGKSIWRKYVRDGDAKGIKAKTQYPTRPDDWPASKDWAADIAYSLIKADLLRGKSIGFLPTKVHAPTDKEIAKNNWQGASLVIDEWLLLEYACVFLPMQQEAVVEEVSKGLPEEYRKALSLATPGLTVLAHMDVKDIEQAITTAIGAMNFKILAENALAKTQGRV